MKKLIAILLLIPLLAIPQISGEALIFKYLGEIEPLEAGVKIRHKEFYQLKENEFGAHEATFVFSVQNPGYFKIGISSHDVMNDFDLMLFNHTSNEIIESASIALDGYLKIETYLEKETMYRFKIIGSEHDRRRNGMFYIHQVEEQI